MKPELHPVSLEHQADPHSGTKPRHLLYLPGPTPAIETA